MRFTARDILLRWTLLCVCLCAPSLALMYLPARWAVALSLIAGYETRCVVAVFGAPFQQQRKQRCPNVIDLTGARRRGDPRG